jgi:DNA-binding transcriptional LysR family regulator
VNLNQLRAFVEVAERLSFSESARSLGVSQPAVTLQVRALEQQLGAELFERRHKKVSLTEAGRLLLPEARAILERWRKAADDVAAMGGQVAGRLVIGGSTTPSDYLLPPLIGAFRSANPDLTVGLDVGDSRQVVELLKQGEVEIAFVGREPKERRVECRPWASDRIVAVAPPSNPLAKASAPVTLARLIAEPLIVREKGSATRGTVEAHLSEQGITPADLSIAFELGSNEGMVNAVASGLGLAFLSEHAVRSALALGTVARLEVETLPIQRSIWLCTLSGGAPSRAAQAMIDFAMANPPG